LKTSVEPQLNSCSVKGYKQTIFEINRDLVYTVVVKYATHNICEGHVHWWYKLHF